MSLAVRVCWVCFECFVLVRISSFFHLNIMMRSSSACFDKKKFEIYITQNPKTSISSLTHARWVKIPTSTTGFSSYFFARTYFLFHPQRLAVGSLIHRSGSRILSIQVHRSIEFMTEQLQRQGGREVHSLQPMLHACMQGRCDCERRVGPSDVACFA